jgi:hypothetical protein
MEALWVTRIDTENNTSSRYLFLEEVCRLNSWCNMTQMSKVEKTLFDGRMQDRFTSKNHSLRTENTLTDVMLICLFDCDHDVPVHLYDGDRT